MFDKLKNLFKKKQKQIKTTEKPTFYISAEAFEKMDIRQKMMLLERYDVRTPTFIKENNV